MRTLTKTAFVLALGTVAMATSPAPRKAPELTVVVPSGRQLLLSNLRGTVTVLAFVRTTCPHCQVFCRMLTKLSKDMGPHSFQPLAVAVFDNNSAPEVTKFGQDLGLTFPVGFGTSPETFYNFMGYSPSDRVMVPQVVVVDKKGMIRAQSPVAGDPDLQDETKLKALIESLMKEGAAPHAAHKTGQN